MVVKLYWTDLKQPDSKLIEKSNDLPETKLTQIMWLKQALVRWSVKQIVLINQKTDGNDLKKE